MAAHWTGSQARSDWPSTNAIVRDTLGGASMNKLKSLVVILISRSAIASAIVVWLVLRMRREHEQG